MGGRLEGNSLANVRLMAALVVVAIHAAILSGRGDLKFLVDVLGPLAPVTALFGMSGFLIAMSYERSRSLGEFLGKRFWRIYPAYAAIILTVATLAPVKDDRWLAYIVANLSTLNFLQPNLPGLFASNPEQAVNGSLWTVKVDFAYYIALPMMIWAVRRWGAVAAFAAMYLLSTAYVAAMLIARNITGEDIFSSLAIQFPGMLSCFAAGGLIYYRYDFFERNVRSLTTLSLSVVALNYVVPLSALLPAALAVLVVSAGLFIKAGRTARWPDLSYGLYLVHYPIIQALVAAGLHSEPLYLPLAFTLSMAGAALIWALVERPIQTWQQQRTKARPRIVQPIG